MAAQTNKTHFALRALCEGAVMVALAQILGYLKLYELPQGGSITLSMLPIFFFAVRWGLKDGLLCSFVFGILQLLLDGRLCHRLAVYAGGLHPGLRRAGAGRPLCWEEVGRLCGHGHRLRSPVPGPLGGGRTIWAEYMPDEFFGMTMTSPWFYSALYNGSYMVIDMAACLVVFAVLYVPMKKYFLGQDLQK